LLAIFHYVFAGVTAMLSFLPLVYVWLGFQYLTAPERWAGMAGAFPPESLGLIFIVLGLGVTLIGLTLALCSLLAARWLRDLKHYWLCVLTAAQNCAAVPAGTILGICTLLVLLRPSVRSRFGVVAGAQESVR
jgi:hypothetical protein